MYFKGDTLRTFAKKTSSTTIVELVDAIDRVPEGTRFCSRLGSMRTDIRISNALPRNLIICGRYR